tara:strand:+ start:95 stop:361 length:267 start_codon:yes stop_codon:yes gene_type:complete
MRDKKYIDEWLKKEIKKGIDIIGTVKSSNWTKYYTGHLHKDILDNYPGRTSKKIFQGYRKFLNNDNYIFTQKKFSDHGYEYYVRKVGK